MLFGFEQLDELAFLASNKAIGRLPKGLVAESLGVIIELQSLRSTGLILPSIEDLSETRRLQLCKTILGGERTATFGDRDSSSGLIRCYWEPEEEPDDWYDFCQSVQHAAGLAGFPTRNARELVAATRELVANIFDHSTAASSGIAGYSFSQKRLEIVVADQGIGVLKSLKLSHEFAHLRDSGEAIQAALIDGTSRFGAASGHGGGFRALFRGLVNLSSTLRFRSGDHALEISGIGPGVRSGRLSQKAELPGFVISLSCRL